jgi:hypothetical protein
LQAFKFEFSNHREASEGAAHGATKTKRPRACSNEMLYGR